jgi:hypothetical protein
VIIDYVNITRIHTGLNLKPSVLEVLEINMLIFITAKITV